MPPPRGPGGPGGPGRGGPGRGGDAPRPSAGGGASTPAGAGQGAGAGGGGAGPGGAAPGGGGPGGGGGGYRGPGGGRGPGRPGGRGPGGRPGGPGRGPGGPGRGPGGPGGGRGPRGGPGGGRDGRGGPDEDREGKLIETVVRINRNAKVVKGGRRFTFSALVTVGDRRGQVGLGYGKANEVPQAVEKAVKDGAKNLFKVPMVAGGTIPHEVIGSFGASRVFMRPAAAGTGVIAGAAVKAVLVASGLQNVLTKSFGSTNPVNLCKAAVDALTSLRTREQVMKLRGVPLDEYAWPKPLPVKTSTTTTTAAGHQA